MVTEDAWSDEDGVTDLAQVLELGRDARTVRIYLDTPWEAVRARNDARPMVVAKERLERLHKTMHPAPEETVIGGGGTPEEVLGRALKLI